MKKLVITEKDLKSIIKKYISENLSKQSFNKNLWFPRSETIIKEGLIMSYEPSEVINIVNRLDALSSIGTNVSVSHMFMGYNYHSAYKQGPINKKNRTTQDKNRLVAIKIVAEGKLNKSGYKSFLYVQSCLNRCGYFLGGLIINGEIVIKKINRNIWSELSDKYSGTFLFRFEPKYDVNVHVDNVPNLCYHITPKKNIGKILKNGLVPKSGGKISSHPERVYLFMWKPEDWKKIARMFSTVTNCKEFVLVEVNTYSLRDKIKFYFDQNTFRGYPDAIYTFEPIPAKLLKIIDEYTII